jgi:hypothetical protein
VLDVKVIVDGTLTLLTTTVTVEEMLMVWESELLALDDCDAVAVLRSAVSDIDVDTSMVSEKEGDIEIDGDALKEVGSREAEYEALSVWE